MIIILLLLPLVRCVIQVHSQMQVKEVTVGIGQYVDIRLPDFPFKNVYESWAVWSTEQEKTFKMEDICRSVPPRINMWRQFDLMFEQQNISTSIDSFQKIWVVDLYRNDNGIVYVLFGNGSILVVRQEKQLKIVRSIQLQVGDEIDYGQFMMVSGTLFLITETEMYKMTENNAEKVAGFGLSKGLVAIQIIHDRWLALALQKQGIVFYQILTENMVRQVSGFGASLFNRQHINIEDMQWHESTSTLLVLQQQFGVYMCHVSTSNQRLDLSLLSQGIFKKQCNNMVGINNNIYLSCREIYRFNVVDLQSQVLESPQFHVWKMLKFKQMLIVIGRNDLVIYEQNKKVEDLEFEKSEILRFIEGEQKQSGQFLSVTPQKLTLGNYTIKLPVVKCGTTDHSRTGTMKMLIKTEAQCSNEYFTMLSLQASWSQGDICVYTVPITVTVTKQKQINIRWLGYILLAFMIVIIILMIWACRVRSQANKLQQALRSFYRQKQPQKVQGSQPKTQAAQSEVAITS